VRTALVTGAGGFLGRHVVDALTADGWRVRGLARRSGPSFAHVPAAAEAIDADLRDRRAVRQAIAGVDAVFHTAATYSLARRRARAILRDDVDATASVLAACRADDVPLVHTSSVATIGQPGGGLPGTEETPLMRSQLVGAYKTAKLATESMARGAAREGAHVVIVNPTAPVGPGDWRPTPTGRLIADSVRGRMPAVVDTGLNVVGAADVARGHLLALERGEPGRRYILGGEDMTLAALVATACRTAGRRAPTLVLPHAVAIGISAVDELLEGWLAGREPRAPLDGALMARKTMYASSARAERELGYSAGPASAAIAEAVAWSLGASPDHTSAPAEGATTPGGGR
jgi:dihydroflavonol-4-reductase